MAVNPCGAIHLTKASGSINALKTRYGGALKTQCKRTVPDIVILHFHFYCNESINHYSTQTTDDDLGGLHSTFEHE